MLGIHIWGEMPYPSVPKPIHGLKELRDILKGVKTKWHHFARENTARGTESGAMR